jgi:subtilisin family serine protease
VGRRIIALTVAITALAVAPALAASGPVVAVVDSGVDMTHPALRKHLWTNPGEVAGNKVDDDGDGFVDDVHGADFVTGDGDPMDPRGHGTHIAGMVTKRSRARVMALRVIARDGRGTDSALAQAIDYAVAHGARVINLSVAYYDASDDIEAAVRRASDAGVLLVAAAGNDHENLDVRTVYPASYHVPTMLVVAATADGKLARWSARGRAGVDIAAPGSARSTLPGGRYGILEGTSQATARVTRAAAVILTAHPELDALAVRAALLGTAAKAPSLVKTTASGGALDVAAALTAISRVLG